GGGCSGPGRALVVRWLRTRAGPGTPSACPARQRYFRALVAAEGWRDRTAHVEAADRAGRNRHGPAPLPLAFGGPGSGAARTCCVPPAGGVLSCRGLAVRRSSQ